MKMSKYNPFNYYSPLFPFRWYISITLFVVLLMAWHDFAGGRIFDRSGQQQWSSSGSGYHK